MRRQLFPLFLIPLLASSSWGARRPLDLPVRAPGAHQAAPAYAGDVIEIRLAPEAARRAWPAYRQGAPGERLGLAALDRESALMGDVRFTPMFRGESSPAPGLGAADFTAFYVAHLPPGLDLETALDRFAALPEVASAEPIAILPLDAVPNDSLWASSYYYFQASRRDVHAPEAWDISTGDTSIVVGILDTGVVPYHPDLGGTVAGLPGQIFTNWIEAAGLPGVDDDANGYVDDLHGWDFVALASSSDVAPGEDWRDEDNDPNDFVAHGTAVAGVVGALTDNTIGVAGMNWKVRVLPLRIGWAFLGASLGAGEVRMDFVAAAVRYAARNGAHVINCSFANLIQSGLDLALDEATGAGVTVVTSAGNNGQPNEMALRRDVISVASTGPGDVLSGFSNRGPQVDLAAPGENIATTWLGPRPATTDSLLLRQSSYRSTLNGTSFSAPLVAGAAALLQARQAELGLEPLHPMTVQLRLFDTADDIRAENPGRDGQYGSGRLNAARALTEPWRSTALRLGAKVVGPSAVLAANDGTVRLLFALDDRRLVMLDGATLATLWTAALPFIPVTGPAYGLLPGRGLGVFVGLTNGRIAGFDAAGTPLPGWPKTGGGSPLRGGPAVADLDGDGMPEVTVGSDDGRVYSWHADGSAVAGFPVDVALGFRVGAVAVTHDAPARIAATADIGTVVWIDHQGNLLPGWPVTVSGTPSAPVVTAIQGEEAMVLIEGSSLHAFSADGNERPGFPVAVGVSVPARSEVAIGDLDQNGVNDLVIGGASPARLEVRDSTGASLGALGWPRTMTSGAVGAPVLGHLTGGGAPEAMLLLGTGLTGFSNDADSLLGFPKPGGGGTFPTLADLDGDGTTEVLAGSTLDPLLFVYDAGPGSASPGPQPWPTLRGDFQRSGSNRGRPPALTLDLIAPGAVADLSAEVTSPTSVRLRWTATGDDVGSGTARAYDLRWSLLPIDAGNFDAATVVPSGAASAAGVRDSADATGLTEGFTYYFAVRAVDEFGNRGPISNIASGTLFVEAPGMVADLRVVAVTDTTVSLAWTATGGDGNVGRPQSYVVRGRTGQIDDSNFNQSPYVRTVVATVDAGGTESVTFAFLDPATRYWFALKAFDSGGNGSPLSNVAIAQTQVGGPIGGRTGLALAPLSNPSRVPASLYWQSAPEAQGLRQEIRIYDLTGRRVRTLDLGQGIGGVAPWDGRDDDGNRVGAGLYLARLLSGPRHTQARLVLLP